LEKKAAAQEPVTRDRVAWVGPSDSRFHRNLHCAAS
jgi:hypothetical protein